MLVLIATLKRQVIHRLGLTGPDSPARIHGGRASLEEGGASRPLRQVTECLPQASNVLRNISQATGFTGY